MVEFSGDGIGGKIREVESSQLTLEGFEHTHTDTLRNLDYWRGKLLKLLEGGDGLCCVLRLSFWGQCDG